MLPIGLALTMAIASGCGGKSDGSIQQPGRVDLATGAPVDITWNGTRAVSMRTAAGDSVQFVDGEAAMGDELVIQTEDGKVEVHRRPNAVMNAIDTLPHLYLKEDTLEEFVSDGFRGEPYVDSQQRALYWSAMKCINPNCESQSMGTAERPRLFINRRPGVWLEPDGTLASAQSMPESLDQPCPFCGRRDSVRLYFLPGTEQRREELAGELADVRSARDRALSRTSSPANQ